MHGEAIEYLNGDGAIAIGFDIIFPERTTRREFNQGEVNELRSFAHNLDIPEVRSELVRRLDAMGSALSDTGLISAVERGGNVFQPSVFYADERDLKNDPGLGADEEAALNIRAALSRSSVPAAGYDPKSVYFNATVPFAELSAASRGVGHINLSPDKDGVCRRSHPLIFFRERGKAYPSLPLLMAAHAKSVPPIEIRTDGDTLTIGDSMIPLLPDSSAYIFYQGGEISQDGEGSGAYNSFYRHIPYEYVLASKDLVDEGRGPLVEGGTFRGKLVLITASAMGLADLKATPFSPVTPAIEIHANILDNILSNRFLRGIGKGRERIYVLLLALSVALISRFLGPIRGFFATAAFTSSVVAVHWGLFGGGYLLPVVQPAAAMSGTYLGVLLLKYAVEHREKRYIKSAFGHYIAPAVLEEILRSPEKLGLGGEKRRMTVLFSDIEGFTTLSEKLAPEEIGLLLNGYLTSMVQCVMRMRGTLDKFIGDAVMAFWNAPAEEKGHAALACEAALSMMEAVTQGSDANGGKHPAFNIRIGINTGEMIAGNMGSKDIFDYTVLGAEVNIASRLESLNKDFGTSISVSRSTRDEAQMHRPGMFVFRRLADVILKGRDKTLTVYELVGLKEDVGGKVSGMIEIFEKGLGHFSDSRFGEAKKLFRESLELVPEDWPSRKYISLCDDYEKEPPPEGWRGEYIQRTK